MSITQPEILPTSLDRQTHIWFSGFLLLGILAGLLGPLLILWREYLDVDARVLGLHALALNGGCFTGLLVGRIQWRPMGTVACTVCAAAFISLPFIAPPAPVVIPLLVLGALGFATGALSIRLGLAIAPRLHNVPTRVANIGGAYFGAGALLATTLSEAGYVLGQPGFGLACLCIVPVTYLLLTRGNNPWVSGSAPDVHQNVRPIATSLLSALLFFQIGNEWALAVWLPFFLIHKLGAGPSVAMSLLAIHFVFLLLGRWLAKALLPIVNHRRFLLAGIGTSITGYLVLATANTLPSATTAVILVGFALGPVLPIAAENLDRNLSGASVRRILLAAVSGATVEPFLTGFVCAEFGVPKIMFVPAVGAIVVCMIALLMMLESRLMGAYEIA